jgi:hypothetical protein
MRYLSIGEGDKMLPILHPGYVTGFGHQDATSMDRGLKRT